MSISQSLDQSSLGARLRTARESRGLQLVDIAGTLRIKPQFLDALESDRPEALPTPTHASGFLRSYARYLGVDLTDANLSNATPIIPPLAPDFTKPNPIMKVLPLVLVLGVLVILYALWHWLRAPEPKPIAPPPANFGAPKLEPLEPKIEPKAEVAPVSTSTPTVSAESAPVKTVTETPAAPVTTEPAKPAVKPDAAKPDTIVVRTVGDAWVQITDATGRQVYSKLMRTGESWRAPPQAGLRLSTGNAGGIVLVRNGEASAPLGAQAQVLRNMALTASTPKPAIVAKPVPAAPTDDAADSDLEE